VYARHHLLVPFPRFPSFYSSPFPTAFLSYFPRLLQDGTPFLGVFLIPRNPLITGIREYVLRIQFRQFQQLRLVLFEVTDVCVSTLLFIIFFDCVT
jgi:hypothetical protein